MAAIPRSLPMAKNQCFYCDKTDTGATEISPEFGIKFCDDHKAASARDCRAYLHVHKGVTVYDAFGHPATKPFMDMVVDKDTSRVDLIIGAIQGEWRLNVLSSIQKTTLIYNTEGVWMLPLVQYGNTSMYKDMPIIDFIEVAGFPADVVNQALAALDVGLYINDFNEAERARGLQDRPEHGQ